MKDQTEGKIKKYESLVERVLNTFEMINEWADIISFLSKLLRTFSTHSDIKMIPHSIVVSKRLAQCLNPVFPSGVHQKTIEVYEQIFSNLGDLFDRDFYLFGFGILPFFENASTNVKANILSVYNKHIVPNIMKIGQFLPEILSSLASALEDKSNDHFAEVSSVFNKIQISVDTKAFIDSLIKSILISTKYRHALINYFVTNIAKEAFKNYLSKNDLPLFLDTIHRCLNDQSPLVLRGILDMTAIFLSLDYFIDNVSSTDAITIISDLLLILLKKDLSLTRRVYNWILGDCERETALDDRVSNAILESLRILFLEDISKKTDELKFFKVLICLMDRSELSTLLLSSNLLIEVVATLNDNFAIESNGAMDNPLIEQAYFFFQVVDIVSLWGCFITLSESCSSLIEFQRICGILLFAVSKLPIHDESLSSIYFPLVLLKLTQRLSVIEEPCTGLKHLANLTIHGIGSFKFTETSAISDSKLEKISSEDIMVQMARLLLKLVEEGVLIISNQLLKLLTFQFSLFGTENRSTMNELRVNSFLKALKFLGSTDTEQIETSFLISIAELFLKHADLIPGHSFTHLLQASWIALKKDRSQELFEICSSLFCHNLRISELFIIDKLACGDQDDVSTMIALTKIKSFKASTSLFINTIAKNVGGRKDSSLDLISELLNGVDIGEIFYHIATILLDHSLILRIGTDQADYDNLVFHLISLEEVFCRLQNDALLSFLNRRVTAQGNTSMIIGIEIENMADLLGSSLFECIVPLIISSNQRASFAIQIIFSNLNRLTGFVTKSLFVYYLKKLTPILFSVNINEFPSIVSFILKLSSLFRTDETEIINDFYSLFSKPENITSCSELVSLMFLAFYYNGKFSDHDVDNLMLCFFEIIKALPSKACL